MPWCKSSVEVWIISKYNYLYSNHLMEQKIIYNLCANWKLILFPWVSSPSLCTEMLIPIRSKHTVGCLFHTSCYWVLDNDPCAGSFSLTERCPNIIPCGIWDLIIQYNTRYLIINTNFQSLYSILYITSKAMRMLWLSFLLEVGFILILNHVICVYLYIL